MDGSIIEHAKICKDTWSTELSYTGTQEEMLGITQEIESLQSKWNEGSTRKAPIYRELKALYGQLGEMVKGIEERKEILLQANSYDQGAFEDSKASLSQILGFLKDTEKTGSQRADFITHLETKLKDFTTRESCDHAVLELDQYVKENFPADSQILVDYKKKRGEYRDIINKNIWRKYECYNNFYAKNGGCQCGYTNVGGTIKISIVIQMEEQSIRRYRRYRLGWILLNFS